MLYSTLWAYRKYVNTSTSFSPFQLVYGLEAVFPRECQILSLKLVVELFPDTSPLEECLLYLEKIDEKLCDESLANEAHKQRVKCQYDRYVRPWIFSEGDLVLVYDQDKGSPRGRQVQTHVVQTFHCERGFKEGCLSSS
jgi:hypothetical protein